ncbi:thermonuclease family protein [Shewanella sp. GXUN23E]|uniref:thermonuclease family protein n=1 Tax=Shewanella sp. GXUN23E TaxID=3422498 RepID=UPI003D7F0EFB
MTYKSLLLTITITFSPLVAADSVPVSQVISIHDGDTFNANIAEWPPIVGLNIPVRIRGIDTPELRGKCQKEKELARAAKQFTVSQLRAAKQIELKDISRGKYFRLIASVYVDGKSLGDILLQQKLAVPYSGSKKPNWCD